MSSGGSGAISTSYSTNLSVSWEVDLWGKLRRQLEANQASLHASAADLAAVRLSQQSQLAQNYLQLRVMDEQIRLLNDTVTAYERSLKVAENKYRAGIVTRADVAQARTQLKSTQAQAIDLKVPACPAGARHRRAGRPAAGAIQPAVGGERAEAAGPAGSGAVAIARTTAGHRLGGTQGDFPPTPRSAWPRPPISPTSP
ncbi:outer membrane lipoprotein [Pseudomonas aeruginosa]|nr:outer membrane lipoprotein [Pseudomonas aeruginosa]